eukprot:scaffold797_cov111-Amphora_coffeaeformis.AAC.1
MAAFSELKTITFMIADFANLTNMIIKAHHTPCVDCYGYTWYLDFYPYGTLKDKRGKAVGGPTSTYVSIFLACLQTQTGEAKSVRAMF